MSTVPKRSKEKQIISLFVHCFPPAKGGVEFLAKELKKNLNKDYTVHVFTGQGSTLDSYKTFKNLIKQNTSQIHRLKTKTIFQKLANKLFNKIIFKIPFFSPFYFGPILDYQEKYQKIIKKSNLIIGLGMPTKSFYDSYVFAKKFKKKLILIPAYHDVSYYNNCPQFQNAFTYASKIIYLTDFEKNKLTKNYQINQDKLIQSTFCPYTKNQISKQKHQIIQKTKIIQKNIKQKIINIGYIGQITQRKNLLFFKRYLDHYLPFWHKFGYSIKVLLAGAKSNSSNQIQKQFARLISKKNIKIIYNFPDQQKSKLYNSIDFFVNPSIEESLGIVNFEAVFYNCLLLIPPNTAFSEFLTNNKTSHLFNDIHSFHKILKSIIDNPNSLQQTIKKQFSLLSVYNYDNYQTQLIKQIKSLNEQ